jgi:hypothetical protein
MIRGSNTPRVKRFSFLRKSLTGSAAHPAYSRDTKCYFRWAEQLVHEVDHPPPSRAKVKNEWNHTSISYML